MSKATPGPWKVWHSGYANAPFVIYAGAHEPTLDRNNKLMMNGSTRIAEVMCDESPDAPHQLANARVIRTAIELLAALQKAQVLIATDIVRDDAGVLAQINRTLASAEWIG